MLRDPGGRDNGTASKVEFCECSGYVMDLGETDFDFGSPAVRKDILNALFELHSFGWMHGDARVANSQV